MIVVLSMLVGCATGLISGYVGGIVDEIMMRVVDVFLAFPGIVLSIAVAGMLGPGLRNVCWHWQLPAGHNMQG